MTSFTDALPALGDLSVPFAPTPVNDYRDDALLAAQRAVAEVRRRVEAQAAVVAAEIAHRSRRELGHSGLAATRGQRTPEGLISQLTGTSVRDARTLVKAGELQPTATGRMAPNIGGADVDGAAEGADAATPAMPTWLTVIGDAVATAAITVDAAQVIRTRLGAAAKRLEVGDDPTEMKAETRDALETALAAAATRLVADAPGLAIEQLVARASAARDELDVAGVATREAELREKRYLRVFPQSDGSAQFNGLFDPESAAIVVPVLEAFTSPRRGGPRFVDSDAVERAEDIVRDTRSTEQLTLDTFVELIRMGAQVDDGKLLGERKPAVRILVTAADLEAPRIPGGNRSGAAFFEGQVDAISIETVERFICSSGAVPILFDGDGRVLNLGREQRLFSEKQRIAMAARDGGCLMCDRPPSWTEAHHIDHWEAHHGRTDIDDGVLLCRHCHLLLHNRGWRIRREGGAYFLERPDDDGILRRTPLPTRSRAVERLRHSA
jgi:hypothetical protein